MKHLVDLEYLNNTFRGDAVLSALYEHSCELNITPLVSAIELYWEQEADALTAEEFNEAQEQSIKSQFGEE